MARGTRVLRWFDRKTERCVGEEPLRGIGVAELRKLFQADRTDPMYGCFPVSEAQAAALVPHVAAPIRVDRYDYSVEYDAPPLRAAGRVRPAAQRSPA